MPRERAFAEWLTSAAGLELIKLSLGFQLEGLITMDTGPHPVPFLKLAQIKALENVGNSSVLKL